MIASNLVFWWMDNNEKWHAMCPFCGDNLSFLYEQNEKLKCPKCHKQITWTNHPKISK